ncbi:MAG: phosphate acyltransferase [Pseudomonadota bacterium]
MSGFLNPAAPVCPPALIEEARKAGPARVAIARAGAKLPMAAAHAATEAGVMEPIFVGEADAIRTEAEALGWDIGAFRLVDAAGEAEAGDKAARLTGAGEADALMKGHLHTDVFMKAALNREAGLRTGRRLVHVFHISPPDGGRSVMVSDAALNVAPDMETRQASLRAVAALGAALGLDRPKIAVLSATETPIPSMPSSEEARALADWALAERVAADVSGPLALDLAISPEATAVKGLEDDPVAGRADAILVPDIVSGNALFKALVYLGGGCAGGVVMGASAPILLTSRADPPAARLASAALATLARGC